MSLSSQIKSVPLPKLLSIKEIIPLCEALLIATSKVLVACVSI